MPEEEKVKLELTKEQYSKLIEVLSLDFQYKNLNNFKQGIFKELPQKIIEDIENNKNTDNIETAQDLIRCLFYIDSKKVVPYKGKTSNLNFLDTIIFKQQNIAEEAFNILCSKNKYYKVGYNIKDAFLNKLIDNKVVNKNIIA